MSTCCSLRMSSGSATMKDLFVLVADADMRETLTALLQRHKSLGIRPVTYEVERHFRRDPGCRTDASRPLRPRLAQYHKAIVVLDKHGCGREGAAREVIQQEIEQDLAASGWAAPLPVPGVRSTQAPPATVVRRTASRPHGIQSTTTSQRMKYHLIWSKFGVDKRHVAAYGHGRWKPSFASRFDLAYSAAYALALCCLRRAVAVASPTLASTWPPRRCRPFHATIAPTCHNMEHVCNVIGNALLCQFAAEVSRHCYETLKGAKE